MRYLLLMSTVGCEILSNENTPPISENRINFSALEVGQISDYAAFSGENYYSKDETTFRYLAQRLQVEVANETDSGFVFIERILNTNTADCCFRDSARYHVKIENEMPYHCSYG